MNENPETQNRVPVADLAVDACSAKGESPQYDEGGGPGVHDKDEVSVPLESSETRAANHVKSVMEQLIRAQAFAGSPKARKLYRDAYEIIKAYQKISGSFVLPKSHDCRFHRDLTDKCSVCGSFLPNTAGEPHRGAH